jgi:hypothetical protein
MKLFGQLYAMENGHFYGDVSANYKVSDEVVCGAQLNSYNNKTGYFIGASWINQKFVVNGKIGKDVLLFSDDYYTFGGTYKVNEQFDLGLDYIKYSKASNPTIGECGNRLD